MTRCAWVTDDPIYLAYHDQQWGVPVYDERHLFEMLLLEGAQAGLSWITVLKRREGYRAAYDGFDPEVIAGWDDTRIAVLLEDPRIIRNRLKVEGARKNARAYLEVVREVGSFSTFLWQFVDGKPVRNQWKTIREAPTSTPASDAMSKALKKRGFTFVGSTICYAFMQAVGMVDDHTTDCFRFRTP
ncbi:MAG: DNA-3-methyladenine glycosylase I [Rhodothermales bacterium]|nr:DNA-3-methyladenine glycosylase I [Rhodothermales bacterium]